MADDFRNIGIFAHVDAGKTTLSECILMKAGAIRQRGSVDEGTAHTDTLPVERRRGISIKASCVSFSWKECTYNLIDTPGHTDFSAEIERSIWPLDGAILLVDAVEGVQPQTEVLFDILQKQHIPIVIFLNKADRTEARPSVVLKQIRDTLIKDAVVPADIEDLTEYVCCLNETLMEQYVEGRAIETPILLKYLAERTCQCLCCPVLIGSALKDEGVSELLDAVLTYLPSPKTASEELCGVFFSSTTDKIMGRGLLVRLYGGHLKNRMQLDIPIGNDIVSGQIKVEQRKITQIRDVNGNDLGMLVNGNVGVVYGLGDLPIGYVLGKPEALPRKIKPGTLKTPLIKVQISPKEPGKMRSLRNACMELSEEDPMLQVSYVHSLEQLQISLMGMVQLEILEETLKNRFDLEVNFGAPTVIYKETVRKAATGFVDYTMPKPCWAIMTFLIEPGPRGSGVIFESKVAVKDIMACYQHQVEQALPSSLEQGRLGWEVTDVKITLVSGEHHLEHTHPLDFIVATPMGIQDALNNAGSVLLEPILDVMFSLPPENVGRIISDVSTMRGEVLDTMTSGERIMLHARIPVSTSIAYPTELAKITGGKGAMNVKLHGYQECPLELGVTTPRRSTDPLDKAKYILVIRHALADEAIKEAKK